LTSEPISLAPEAEGDSSAKSFEQIWKQVSVAMRITVPIGDVVPGHAGGGDAGTTWPQEAEAVGTLKERGVAVARVAAEMADDVDLCGRFPEEAVREMKRQRLLGMLVPRDLGGEGATVSDVVDICYELGGACSSAAMIFAMHQVKVACIVRHGRGSRWHEGLLQQLSDDQLLLASSTTEGQGGGNVRASEAPIVHYGEQISLERAATVISYGIQADGVVTTARRAADAASSDQVLVVLLKDDYSLQPTMSWDTLGMRGTCSGGFALKATASNQQVLPVPYGTIHTQTMVPCAHLMWGGVWAGIAAGAVTRAQSFLRAAMRKSGGELPPGAAHFTKARAALGTLTSLLATTAQRYEDAVDNERVLASLDFQAMINLTKVEASERAVDIVLAALRACGLSGYRNDTPYSIGRSLRDILSSPLMINNDRILRDASAVALVAGIPSIPRGQA
jgi:acyl-CoA dehydrogenase